MGSINLKLSASERLSIAQFLPTEGNTSEQMIGKSILDKTKLTKEVKQQLREWAREHRSIPDEIVGRKNS